MAIDDDLNSLLTSTEDFLKNNALIIYGSNKGGSACKDFVLQATQKTDWRSSASGTTKAVPFYVIYDASTFNGQGFGPKSTSFQANYISMREYDVAKKSWEDTSATHYTLGSDGPAVMVTSKLNGCTFGIGSNADGARLVSHLRPPGQDSSGRLALDQGTRAGFEGGKLDASVMSSTGMNGTVIGVRRNSDWTFYAQRFQMFASATGIIDGVQVYR